MEFSYFDPHSDYSILWRQLPHWAQAGAIAFMTWRLADSMPPDVVSRWIQERDELLRCHGVDLKGNWKKALDQLPKAIRDQLKWMLTDKWDAYLDECHGDCLLRDPALAAIVAESLHHFDRERYELTDFTVMPNHVHLLAAFPDEESMLKQATSWKRFTAVRINRAVGRRGQLWQEDGFDHLVRSPEHFTHYRQYIELNPKKAHLVDGEYLWYSKVLRQTSTDSVGGSLRDPH